MIRIEMLERRRLRSASVGQGYPGYYEVTGSDLADDISISVSMADATFTLDGVTYAGVSYVSVYGNGGDDYISVVSVDGGGRVGASLNGGAGADSLNLNFDGALWGGVGPDTLTLFDSFRGEAYGEAGDDQIEIGGDCIDPQVDGGTGSDTIRAGDNHYGVTLRGGAGDDVIFGSFYDDQLVGGSGNDMLCGLSGRDVFYAGDGAPDRVYGGDGIDTLYGDQTEAIVLGVEYQFVVYG
jgi:Ca2+-binding RTX toxin-like protein